MAGLVDLVARRIDGRFVRLEPLTVDHAEAVFHAGRSPEIWTYMPDEPFADVEAAAARISKELEQGVPYAIIMQETDELAGCISYRNIEPANEAVEVAWVWVDPRFRGVIAGPEAQYLLIMNAFEEFGAGRAWMKTDVRNERSNASLRRFGVTHEGVLRRHYRLSDGFIRDSNIYSVITPEWPELRERYTAFMEIVDNAEGDWRTVAAKIFWS